MGAFTSYRWDVISTFSQRWKVRHRLGIDIAGLLPVTENGNEYNIDVGDYFSKWKEPKSTQPHSNDGGRQT